MVKEKDIVNNKDGTYSYNTRIFIVEESNDIYEKEGNIKRFFTMKIGRTAKRAIAQKINMMDGYK